MSCFFLLYFNFISLSLILSSLSCSILPSLYPSMTPFSFSLLSSKCRFFCFSLKANRARGDSLLSLLREQRIKEETITARSQIENAFRANFLDKFRVYFSIIIFSYSFPLLLHFNPFSPYFSLSPFLIPLIFPACLFSLRAPSFSRSLSLLSLSLFSSVASLLLGISREVAILERESTLRRSRRDEFFGDLSSEEAQKGER